MGNKVAWPVIHLVQRLSMMLTLCCSIYLIVFLLINAHDNSITAGSNNVSLKDTSLISAVPVLDSKPNGAAVSVQSRDIFSLSDIGPSGTVENTPKGQLPAHLKIVAMLIANPSQIVIEDAFAKKTFFIDTDHPQDGIKMVSAGNGQMVVNYQGQDITVPLTKN